MDHAAPEKVPPPLISADHEAAIVLLLGGTVCAEAEACLLGSPYCLIARQMNQARHLIVYR